MWTLTARPSLQWGRNFIVAEIDEPDLRRFQPGYGFNGAATLSLRKFSIMSPETRDRIMLQWGRNFIVAEIDKKNHCKTSRRSASMGPQLYRCGNVRLETLQPRRHYRCFNGAATLSLRKCNIWAAHWVLPARTLQWGRNFIVAEMIAAFQSVIDWTQLQWGRNFIVAEMNIATVTSISFNGAATLSLRKSRNPDCIGHYGCVISIFFVQHLRFSYRVHLDGMRPHPHI